MKQDRRTFLKDSSLLGAGIFLSPAFLAQAKTWHARAANGQAFIGALTAISAIEDSCTLAFASGKVPAALSNNLIADHNQDMPGNKGRLAGVIPPHDKRILQLLDHLRDNPEAENHQVKAAIAFGFAAHCGYSEIFSPVFKAFGTEESRREAAIYQDAALLQSLTEEHSLLTAGEVEEIIRVLHPRAITRTHTLKPDYDDGPGWVNRMAEWRKGSLANFTQYARAFADPEADKVDKYVRSPGFYDAQGPAILACRRVQEGLHTSPKEIEKAVAKGGNSLYEEALVKGYHNIIAVSEYLQGKTDAGSLATAMKLSGGPDEE